MLLNAIAWFCWMLMGAAIRADNEQRADALDRALADPQLTGMELRF